MTEPEKAWVAGILDGEGSIVFQRQVQLSGGYSPRVKVINTDPRMLVRLKEITGVGYIYENKVVGNRKRAWTWIAACEAALNILEAIRPYLVVKGEQADIAMAFRQAKRSRSRAHKAENARKLEQQEWLDRRLKALKHEQPSLDSLTGHKLQSAEVK